VLALNPAFLFQLIQRRHGAERLIELETRTKLW